MKPSPFVYPESVRFECTGCGDCCRTGQVMLGPGESDALASLTWPAKSGLEGVPPAKLRSGVELLARRADGSCVYLGDRGHCLVHETFGAMAKPLICRLFPFGFQPIGDRIAVDVSFACKSVSEHSGPLIGPSAQGWDRFVAEAGWSDDALHPFSAKYAIDGSLLWEIEHQLLELLAMESASLLLRVRIISEFMRLAMTADPRTEAARTLRRVMRVGVVDQVRDRPAEGEMDKTQRALFFQLLFIHLNPAPIEIDEASTMTKTKEVAKRVAAANAYRRDRSHPWIDNEGIGVGYREVSLVSVGYLGEPDGVALVERYLASKLVGQRFMQAGEDRISFTEAVPRWLLLYPMCLWTAKALAAADSETSIGPTHAHRAVRLLDRSFGQVRFSELSNKQRKMWQFILTETDFPVVATLDLLGTS